MQKLWLPDKTKVAYPSIGFRGSGGERDSICQEMYGLLFCYGCKYSVFWLIMPRKILKVLLMNYVLGHQVDNV